MSVNKVKDITIKTNNVGMANGTIEIEIKEQYAPVLIDTYWSDRILIWWKCDYDDDEGRFQVCIYSIQELGEEEESQIIKKCAEPDVMKAIYYVFDKLT